ncbi:universal stress protein [Denitromonas iodatirespirans]|uniref:Universal stress protein n=1 Tax=Denitromonas iodatirespirans TaxID=2795389 RepID=A0A944DBT8_DENI1|nr:universal stress protein [Denitromonas iodatirespirans]MBT0961633.1 universal stress protein [Denitromonas iodatirespirans]
MLKILVPVDGSAFGEKAIAHVLKLHRQSAQIEVHLLNVQIPVESGHVRMFVEHDTLEDYYREEGFAALEGARAALDAAGVPCQVHIAVGHVADTILRYAEEKGFDKIVMGTHGRTGLMQVLLGSIAEEVLQHSSVPVTLVK